MRYGDFYLHYKGGEYFFDSIALPIDLHNKEHAKLVSNQIALDAHTPDGEDIREINLYDLNGVTLIDSEDPHIIYQSDKDYETDKVWARKVDEFFGCINHDGLNPTLRFTKMS